MPKSGRGLPRRTRAWVAATAIVVTLTTTVVASLSGYAVARLRFPGREAVATLVLILYLVPPALLFIPLYRVLAELGATNQLTALFRFQRHSAGHCPGLGQLFAPFSARSRKRSPSDILFQESPARRDDRVLE